MYEVKTKVSMERNDHIRSRIDDACGELNMSIDEIENIT